MSRHRYWRGWLLVLGLTVLVLHYLLLDDLAVLRYRLRPIWPHAYQHLLPHGDLLDRVHRHMDNVQPPVFTFQSKTNDNSKIPKLVHLMWKDEAIPSVMKPWVMKWSETNPDWTVLFWTDESMNKFVERYYPSLVHVYHSLTVAVQRADMFRYMLLLSFGGVWTDLDVEPLKSLNPVRDMGTCLFSEEPPEHHQISSYFAFGRYAKNNYTLACNAVMACRPGHPFMFFLLSKLTERSPLVTRSGCNLLYTLWCTGPELLTQTYVFYKWSGEKRQETSSNDDVIMVDRDVFLPTFDTGADTLAAIHRNCRRRDKLAERGRHLCQQLEARKFTNPSTMPIQSYTNHHWFHTYYLGAQYQTTNIRQIIPNIIFFFENMTNFIKEHD